MADPTPLDSRQPDEKVAALIVAAGSARRMGRPKALLPWRGSSLLRRITEVAAASPCDPIHVVLGSGAEALEAELRGIDVTISRNLRWHSGIGSSIAAGVSDLPGGCTGVLLLLCDQPFATSELIEQLLEARAQSALPMAACRYDDTLGPPACFDASLFEKLKGLAGDRGAKSLLLADPDKVALIDFARGAIDIDTPEDYDRALAILAGDMSHKGS